jgi:hypothetical protein
VPGEGTLLAALCVKIDDHSAGPPATHDHHGSPTPNWSASAPKPAGYGSCPAQHRPGGPTRPGSSTPHRVECGHSRETTKRSELAGLGRVLLLPQPLPVLLGPAPDLHPADLLIIADKGYVSRELDTFLTEHGVRLLRPSYRNRTPHPTSTCSNRSVS